MNRFWRNFRSQDGGASAVEFALVLPLMVGLLLFGLNTWMQLSHTSDAETALHTGARYYQDGGSDDDAAKTLALASWPNRPSDAAMSVARSCACGVETVSCSTTCDGLKTPKTFITLTAQSTFRGFNGSSQIQRQETLRVR